jgi:hypothetical protein
MAMSKKPRKPKDGDKLHVVRKSGRGTRSSPRDSKHAKAIGFARRSFRKFADTYKALAKS